MVGKNLLSLALFASLMLPIGSQAQTTTPAEKPEVFILTPKQVAELVLKQSYNSQQINLTAQSVRLSLAEIEKIYDFQFSLESGYQKSKFQVAANNNLLEDQQYLTNINLKKAFATGTEIELLYGRLSYQPQFSSLATAPYNKYTEDIFGVTLEQSLLSNFFGVSSRAILRAGRNIVDASEIDRVANLQDLVLDAIRLYWKTYVAQRNFQEALNSRSRYSKLVETVKKKTNYGYSNPGELAQAQAELEDREQIVKNTSTTYLFNLESLVTLLKLPANSEIKFPALEDIPAPPKIERVNVENLRRFRSSKLKAEASEERLKAAKSYGYPDVALVGKYYQQGLEESADDSYSEMVNGSRPKYYVGVKVTYNFGSSYESEYLLNTRVNRDLAANNLVIQRLNDDNFQNTITRRIQADYAIALSARSKRNYREKAAQELTKAYNQGRTEIKAFIDVLNSYFTSEVEFSRAVGDYHTSLNDWAAFRDELIPETTKE